MLMKRILLSTSLLGAGLLSSTQAQVAYTAPSGYIKVEVPAATATGPSFTTFSVSLLNEVEFSSSVTINSDFTAGTNNDPGTQTISVADVTWTANQWTTVPYLAFISTAGDPANSIEPSEEFFTVMSNTANTLTIATDFNLLTTGRPAADQFPATTTLVLRKANTVASVLNQASPALDESDRAYIWEGSGFNTYFRSGSSWRRTAFFPPVDNEIVYPDRGIFLQRSVQTPTTFTFFGDVPVKSQGTILPGQSLDFVGNRYPVGGTVAELGLNNLPGWVNGVSGDQVYIWRSNNWAQYYYTGSSWRKVGQFPPAGGDSVAPNSAIFVSRVGTSTNSVSNLATPLPYNPTAP